ncbi:MAG: NusG domain II-containing protein [Ruminococcus sp.]|uniref:NusG domain II-containing protein n=1 Tax=Ruminococcus sp. TaxID=41978 RepID=UPI0026003923|nr:NusG domain II-containing protein [Ruminococcus sp.]MCR5601825.1 NusG domain II-containing protein [Ruminococcus sp.]
MTKGVKILIAAAALLFVGSLVWILLSFRDSDSTIVEVVQNNKVIYTFDLSKEKDRTIRVNAPDGGWNDIKIENGTICISDADCSDHTCVKTGVLRSEQIPIVCLPHRLVIRYADKRDS